MSGGTYGNLNRVINKNVNESVPKNTKGSSLDFRIAQVTDIIIDDSHPLYTNPTDLRKVEFTIIADNNVEESFRGIATPASSELTTLPTKNEIVVILNNPTNKGNSSFYYINTLNLFNNGLYNPNGYSFQIDDNDELDLGKGISEELISKIRKLLLSPGDISLEGKFGNSIKLGNSNELSINNNNVKTPYEGDNNKPIIIIRNGQRDPGNELSPQFEDINEDKSSIYLTDSQTLPLNVASTNLETFNIELEETITDQSITTFNSNNRTPSTETTPVYYQTEEPTPTEVINTPEIVGGEYPDDGDKKFKDIIEVIKENILAPFDKFFGNGQPDTKEFNPNNPVMLTKITKELIGIPSNHIIINASEPYLINEAVEPFIKLLKAFYKANLDNPKIPNPTIVINGLGRSIEMQNNLYKKYLNGGNLAAKPGNSNHGWNTAVDMSWFDSKGKYIKSSQRNGWNEKGFLSEQYEWLFKNSPKYGWMNPKGLRDGIRNEEYWHWEYWGTGIKREIKKDPLSLGSGVINIRWTEENFELDPSVKNPVYYKTGKESIII